MKATLTIIERRAANPADFFRVHVRPDRVVEMEDHAVASATVEGDARTVAAALRALADSIVRDGADQ